MSINLKNRLLDKPEDFYETRAREVLGIQIAGSNYMGCNSQGRYCFINTEEAEQRIQQTAGTIRRCNETFEMAYNRFFESWENKQLGDYWSGISSSLEGIHVNYLSEWNRDHYESMQDMLEIVAAVSEEFEKHYISWRDASLQPRRIWNTIESSVEAMGRLNLEYLSSKQKERYEGAKAFVESKGIVDRIKTNLQRAVADVKSMASEAGPLIDLEDIVRKIVSVSQEGLQSIQRGISRDSIMYIAAQEALTREVIRMDNHVLGVVRDRRKRLKEQIRYSTVALSQQVYSAILQLFGRNELDGLPLEQQVRGHFFKTDWRGNPVLYFPPVQKESVQHSNHAA